MSKKTIIIFITTFVVAIIIIFSVYSSLKKTDDAPTPTENNTPWYQNFNPFGAGKAIIDDTSDVPDTDTTNGIIQPEEQSSRFYQITDFAVSGAIFKEDTRVIDNTNSETGEIKTIINADTREGRREIQTILNEKLSLNPPLVVDGIFGNKAKDAIRKFQELNNLSITGIIDIDTAPYFIKTENSENVTYEDAPSVRFVQRMNGHIYKMFLDTKIKEKISNSTIPSIYETFFNKEADTVIYRYLSTENIINSFIATLGAVKGEFLPQNISDLSISPDKTKFFYLTKNESGVTGVIETFGETKKDFVFNSPFTEWLSQWDKNGRIFLTTKPSYSVHGSIFLLNTTNKTISKIFGGINGLTTMVSPDGSYVLYSSSTDTGPKLGIFDIIKHSTKDLNTYGLPEKCIWSKDNINVYCAVPNTVTGIEYPDVWYQGLVSFDDFFIKINTLTGDKITIADRTGEAPIDAINLFLNDTEDSLFFINKKDSTLWSLNIK